MELTDNIEILLTLRAGEWKWITFVDQNKYGCKHSYRDIKFIFNKEILN